MMKSRLVVAGSGVALVAVAFLASVLAIPSSAPAMQPMQPITEADDVRHAMMRFYEALNEVFEGKGDAMDACWSHADDVTYMGPQGGQEVGWSKVAAMWKQQVDAKLGGKVKPTNIHGVKGTDLAVVVVIEEGENPNVNGQAQKVSIRATNTFRLENGEWKMIGHHTDILPLMEKAAN